ncbi:methyltransferase [Gephyromycinifex aptenodytis]|uniref:methyltransferase n=1 Tax=Gephyromycinifex aptenodytis TaxID=2716227 RepID=UPI0014486007|nr:methyltransferase [Gephyromycinifex aptenodytis]
MPNEQSRPRRAGVETSIRTAAVWESLSRVVAARQKDLGRPLHVLDLGGGSGGFAVPLAERGHHVTVVDPSPDALASLARRAGEGGVAERITALQGDAATLAGSSLEPADLVTCHGVLEYVDDAAGTLRDVSMALAPGGVLSLLLAQRLAVVLSRALSGQFQAAQQALTSEDGRWGENDPLPRRFDADQVREMLAAVGLREQEVHGVRVFADLVPSAFLDADADRAALLELEKAVSEHPTYAFLGHLGAGLHVLAAREA